MRLDERARKWLPWLLLAIAVIATALVYWPGLAGGWVFDDYPNIVDNAAIRITRGHLSLAALVNAALSSPASFLHRPLASLTFATNWFFGDGNPWPFKLTNVVIHLLNGVLLYCMLRVLLRLRMLRTAASPRAARDPLRFEGGGNETRAARGNIPPVLRINPLRSEGGGNETRAARDNIPPVLRTTPLRFEGGENETRAAGDNIPPVLRTDPLRSEGGENETRATGDNISPVLRTDPLRFEGGENEGGTNAFPPPSERRAERMRARAKRDEGDGFPAIDDTAATRLALIVSAAWMLLPINLMAVLYVVQRMESLCQVFVLAGLWAYLHGRWMMLTAADARRERRGMSLAIAGVVLGTLLGLTSKETAVLLPLFAFLAEAVVLRFRRSVPPPPSERRAERKRTRAERDEGDGISHRDDIPPVLRTDPLPQEGGEGINSAARDPLPAEEGGSISSAARDNRLWTFFTVTLFIPAVLGFAWLLRGVLRPGALAERDFTLIQRLMTEPRVLVDYLHWTLLPNPEVLSLYHDEIRISTGLLSPWTTLGAMLLLAALIVIAVLLRNRRPLVALGIGWFFAAQLLTATIVPLELVYEQRMYFASIGVLLAAGVLLLGLRWRIQLPLLRGFIVTIAVLWFGTATLLRAREWSNPLQLAIAEANRHPESPRAVYEAGRLLLIASNYRPGVLQEESWKYLRRANAIHGSSALADQAMIMLADHGRQGDDAAYWDSMIHRLRDQPTRQEDISALVSLTNCYGSDICRFDVAKLQRAYQAALARPHPIARLDGAYAAFQRDILHDDAVATEYLARAVKGAPREPAYRVDLTALYARQGETEKALEQIDALRRMNLAGRLDKQIAVLEQLAEQGASGGH